MDRAEKERFDRSSILKFPIERVRCAIPETALEARNAIEKRVACYLLHFDVDVLDESDFPPADVPHQNGLTLSAAGVALRIFLSSEKCAGLVVAEFNADRDPEGLQAGRLANALVDAMKNGRT